MSSAQDHPGRERLSVGGGAERGRGCGTFQKDLWTAASAPRPRRGQVCAQVAEGGARAAASGFTARRALSVCLPRRVGSFLFTGESRPETPALFLSGLSQVEESIKHLIEEKGRHSWAKTRRPAGTRSGGARPGHACALAQLLPRCRAPAARSPGHLQEGR